MEHAALSAVEARFADLIWANEPLSSTELVKLSEREIEQLQKLIEESRGDVRVV